MQGVQTIGNATLIAYDDTPVLSTDPWMGGDHYAYFGSWYLHTKFQIILERIL